MESDPVMRPARRRAGLFLLALVAVLAAGAALAQSTIDAGSFATQSGTVWQFLRANSGRRPAPTCFNSSAHPEESFTCLQLALSTSGLDTTLSEKGPITLFAPTDAGFRTLARLMGAGSFNALMDNAKELKTVLQGLMVEGRYTSADLEGRAVPATGRLTLPTLAGDALQLTFDRFPTSTGRVKVAVGKETFQPAWTPYLSGHTTVLNNGSVIPMDMLYLPSSMR